MTAEPPAKAGPFAAIYRVIREAFKYEGITPEGRVNLAVLALISIASVAVPILSGTTVKAEWGGVFEIEFGDAGGAIAALVVVAIICLAFVGGSNYMRVRGKL